jgi:lipopolysaccharide/colanic/teichoic acid biosynthesis glycosyltransferase
MKPADPSSSIRLQVVYVGDAPADALWSTCQQAPEIDLFFAPTVGALLEYQQTVAPIDVLLVDVKSRAFDRFRFVRECGVLKHTSLILLGEALSGEVRQTAIELRAADVFTLGAGQTPLLLRLRYLFRKKQVQPPTTGTTHPRAVPAFRMPLWKRAIDVSVALTLLLLAAPLMAVVALLVYLESPGPVLFRSKRVGAGYRVFTMYKFRSMRRNAERQLGSLAALNLYDAPKAGTHPPQDGPCVDCRAQGRTCQYPLYDRTGTVCERRYLSDKKSKAAFSKFKNDPRITPLGRFLRNSSIDELPQLFNILVGDMSLVGNRPLPVYEAERLTTHRYAQRFAAPAGLTGLWQVSKRGRAALSEEERIKLDIEYARTFSFRTDVHLMLRTFRAVWQREAV